MIFKNANKTIKEYVKPSALGLCDENTTEFENCVTVGDKIVSRPGFAIQDDFIYYNGSDYGEEMRLDLTGCFVYVEGQYGRIAVNVKDDLTDRVVFDIRLIVQNGEVKKLGKIEFTRTSATLFGRPEAYTVFNGAAVKGCGLFLLVRKVYGNADDFVMVYELSEDMQTWIVLSDGDLYVPTVLANGRGEKYFSATIGGKDLNLPEPVKPEGRNLIGSRFCCYYTADSTSTGFQLPYSSLDNATVEIKYQNGTKSYTWKVLPDTNKSQTVTIDEDDVFILCDREAGFISFSNGTVLYSPEYTGKLNNIKITASKTVLSDKVRVASKNATCKLEGEAVDAVGTVTLLYGGYHEPSSVFWNSPVHPLYFSERNFTTLGDGTLPVLQLISKDHRIFAIKENKVFSAKIASQKSYCTGGFVTDQGAEKEVDRYALNFENAYTLPEEPIKKSIAILGEDVFYVGVTGRPYKISATSSGHVKTEPAIDATFKVGSDSFGVALLDGYAFFTEKEAWFIKSGKKGEISLAHWSFPLELIGGFNYIGNIVLFVRYEYESNYMVNSVLLEGTIDNYWLGDGANCYLKKQEICCKVSFRPFSTTPEKRRLFRIRADLIGDCSVKISDENGLAIERTLRMENGANYINCPIISQDIKTSFGFGSGGGIRGFTAEYIKTSRL